MKKPRRYQFKPEAMIKMLESRIDFDMSAIEAMHFVGDSSTDLNIYRWLEDEVGSFSSQASNIPYKGVSVDPKTGFMIIATQGGMVYVVPGDWIVRYPNGDFSKYDQEEFESKYILI